MAHAAERGLVWTRRGRVLPAACAVGYNARHD